MFKGIRSARPRRISVAAPVLAGCLVLAGCGGSGHHTAAGHTTAASAKTSTAGSANSSTVSAAAPSPSGLEASLTRAMARDQPYFKNVRVSCPGTQLPVKCRFTATGGLPPIKKSSRVVGTLTVTSVQGKSVQYGLDYAPVH